MIKIAGFLDNYIKFTIIYKKSDEVTIYVIIISNYVIILNNIFLVFRMAIL